MEITEEAAREEESLATDIIPPSERFTNTIVEDEILRRRDIEIEWQNDSDALVRAGLNAGDMLVTTPLGQVSSGIRVSVTGQMGGGRPQNGPPGDGDTAAKPNGAAQ